jgi:hypothetical protein
MRRAIYPWSGMQMEHRRSGISEASEWIATSADPNSLRPRLSLCRKRSQQMLGSRMMRVHQVKFTRGYSSVVEVCPWGLSAIYCNANGVRSHAGELAAVPATRHRRVSAYVRASDGQAGLAGARPWVSGVVGVVAGSGGQPGSTWSWSGTAPANRSRRPAKLIGAPRPSTQVNSGVGRVGVREVTSLWSKKAKKRLDCPGDRLTVRTGPVSSALCH